MNEQTTQSEQPLIAPIPEQDGTRSVTPPTKSERYDGYDFFSEKIGFVPNIRKSDNQLQSKIFLAVWAACVLIGAVFGKGNGALTGLILGMVVALLVSGAVLMVVGLKRKS